MNCELLYVQTRLEKAAEPQIKLPTSVGSLINANLRWIIDKVKEFQKSIYFCFIDYVKGFDCVDHKQKTVENSSGDENTRLPDPPPEKSVCRLRSNS